MTMQQTLPQVESTAVAVPESDVSVYDALYGRRNTWQFTDRVPTHDELTKILNVAVWAPNHKLTEPWRFFVLQQGSAPRQKVVDAVYNSAMKMSNDPERAKNATRKVVGPPSVVFVYSAPGMTEKMTLENYGAVCAAVQNVQLAAYAEGMAIGWESGGIVKSERIVEALGADPEWTCVGFLGIGFPAEKHVGKRITPDAMVRWLD